MRCRGFLLGATAGRTTLAGEGLQHQDGNSHILAYPHPTIRAFDPAFAYELAVIIHDGLERMLKRQDPLVCYITLGNEPYEMPAMPEGSKNGILKGMYRFRPSKLKKPRGKVTLLGSGSIMNEVLKGADRLEETYGVAADVWSVTSYKGLYRDALDTERWNMLHPGEEPRVPYVTECLAKAGVVVAASDYVKALPLSVARWMPGDLTALGTDGFGRSDGRDSLRDFFEVDERYVTLSALASLARKGELEKDVAVQAISDLELDPEKSNPIIS